MGIVHQSHVGLRDRWTFFIDRSITIVVQPVITDLVGGDPSLWVVIIAIASSAHTVFVRILAEGAPLVDDAVTIFVHAAFADFGGTGTRVGIPRIAIIAVTGTVGVVIETNALADADWKRCPRRDPTYAGTG